jgi:hypothetical protein
MALTCCFFVLLVTLLSDFTTGHRFVMNSVEGAVTGNKSEEYAEGWDLRARLEAKIMEYFRENEMTVGENTTGYPGSVAVQLCDTRDNKRWNDNSFELKDPATWLKQFQEKVLDQKLKKPLDKDVFIEQMQGKGKWLEDYPLWDNTPTDVDMQRGLMSLVTGYKFPLTCVPRGHRPFTVKCATTVSNSEAVGLAIAGLQVCFKVHFDNFDLRYFAPYLLLHGTMTVRLTVPQARLGFMWDPVKKGPTGQFNKEDAHNFEVDLLKWQNANDAPVGGVVLRLASFLDNITPPGGSKNKQILDVIIDKVDLFGIIARKISSKIEQYSSKRGAHTITRMITSSTAQSVSNNFAWFTGYGYGNCNDPQGAFS